MNIMQEKSTVIVIFAGLMVFHYNESSHFFKVGILKRAPDHVFDVRKTDPTQHAKPKGTDWANEMVLQVVHANGTDTTEAETPVMYGSKLDRKDSQHPDDWRYAISFDELHTTQGHSIRYGTLGPNIYIRSGQLYTLCLTDFLLYKKVPRGKPMGFGYAAELLGLRVELQRDEKLVLTGTDLEVKYKQGEQQYVVIANVPEPAHRCPKGNHCEDFDTHFQHYYRAIRTTDKYDFGYKDPKPRPTACPNLPPEIAEYLRNAKLEEYSKTPVKTPPPYFCGIGSTSKQWTITNQQLSKQRSENKKH